MDDKIEIIEKNIYSSDIIKEMEQVLKKLKQPSVEDVLNGNDNVGVKFIFKHDDSILP